jgi:hypothetical protein
LWLGRSQKEWGQGEKEGIKTGGEKPGGMRLLSSKWGQDGGKIEYYGDQKGFKGENIFINI